MNKILQQAFINKSFKKPLEGTIERTELHTNFWIIHMWQIIAKWPSSAVNTDLIPCGFGYAASYPLEISPPFK